MADNSDFMLHCEIDNPRMRFAAGKLESDVIETAGFKWTVAIEKSEDCEIFKLRCEKDPKLAWHCHSLVTVNLLRHSPYHPDMEPLKEVINAEERHFFDFDDNTYLIRNDSPYQLYDINDKVTVEFRIDIIDSYSGVLFADSAPFNAPNERSNEILKIGDEKLFVSKEVLSLHSPVFESLFFDNPENGKEEVEIENVNYQELLGLLRLIFSSSEQITDDSVIYILFLAHRFKMEHIVQASLRHLKLSNGFYSYEKHCIAEMLFEELNIDDLRLSNWEFTLLWEIDNVTTRLATGKVESEVFEKGGFKWVIAVEKNGDDVVFKLRCGKDHKLPWKCEADVEAGLANEGQEFPCDKIRFYFNDTNFEWVTTEELKWTDVIHYGYIIQDKINVKISIEMFSTESGELIADLDKFAKPNRLSNVILKIEDKKVHVCKELLAINSPVFERLFFRYSEMGKDEVEIKDIVYEEFLDFLTVVYPGETSITDRCVLRVYKLADRFGVESIVKRSKEHLMRTKGFDIVEKLIIADQFNIDDLKDHCLQSFTDATDLEKKLKSSQEYDNFSSDMKIAIGDRAMQLTEI